MASATLMTAANSHALPFWGDAALHPVIWEDGYKLGLGLSGGGRTRWSPGLETGFEAMVTYFRVRLEAEGRDPVTELGARVYAVSPLSLDLPFTLKLGAFVGYHRLEKQNGYASVGGEAQASFTLPKPWGLYLQFSPGYLIGENSQGIFRLGLGATYAFGKSALELHPVKPPPLAPPPAPEETKDSDFGSTMVPLPEPEPYVDPDRHPDPLVDP